MCGLLTYAIAKEHHKLLLLMESILQWEKDTIWEPGMMINLGLWNHGGKLTPMDGQTLTTKRRRVVEEEETRGRVSEPFPQAMNSITSSSRALLSCRTAPYPHYEERYPPVEYWQDPFGEVHLI